MSRNRLAVIVAGGLLLSAMAACTERTKENMVPTGEVVEVDVPEPDTLAHPEGELVIRDY